MRGEQNSSRCRGRVCVVEVEQVSKLVVYGCRCDIVTT